MGSLRLTDPGYCPHEDSGIEDVRPFPVQDSAIVRVDLLSTGKRSRRESTRGEHQPGLVGPIDHQAARQIQEDRVRGMSARRTDAVSQKFLVLGLRVTYRNFLLSLQG